MAEKPIDPRIDEALKKCNPQKAIYALAEVENEVIDQLGIVETDMDNLETSVNNKITVIEGVANEANTKATNAVTTANQANATANQALTNSETTQTNLTTLEGVVDTAFNAVGNTESTSTVNVDLTTIGGQKKTTALPVASAGKAGVINTSDYIKFEGYDARIKSLEGQSITYLVQFPNNNPTQAEITAAYRTQYPNAPFPPLDSTVLMDTANELSYRWFENSQTWSKISAEPIGLFTLQKEGLIKGSDKVGEVYPNADGTGAVNGWDQLTTRVTNAENGITANTNLANSKGAQLNSGATATGVNVNLLNTAGTQIGTTTLPVASTTQAGIVSAEQVNKWDLGSGFPFTGYISATGGALAKMRIGNSYFLNLGSSRLEIGGVNYDINQILKKASINVQTIAPITEGRNDAIINLARGSTVVVLRWDPGNYTGMVITGTIIFRTVTPGREITDETIFNFVHFYGGNENKTYYECNKEVIKTT